MTNLQKAVIEQMGYDTKDKKEVAEATSSLKDVAEHGASGGYTGFTYYTDTVEFHDKNESEIWDQLYNDADDMGMNIPELIASFNGAKDVGSAEQLKNLLAWYALETVAHQLTDE